LTRERRISNDGSGSGHATRYDVTRDGQRFLINTEPESAPATSSAITVVLNWMATLEK
jgi:hypothetical protein